MVRFSSSVQSLLLAGCCQHCDAGGVAPTSGSCSTVALAPRTNLNRYPVSISSVDGVSTTFVPVRVGCRRASFDDRRAASRGLSPA